MTDEYRIDLIDSDPAAFGPAGAVVSPTPRPRWVTGAVLPRLRVGRGRSARWVAYAAEVVATL